MLSVEFIYIFGRSKLISMDISLTIHWHCLVPTHSRTGYDPSTPMVLLLKLLKKLRHKKKTLCVHHKRIGLFAHC